MKRTLSLVSIYYFLLCLTGCREECLDLEKLDSYRSRTEEWYMNASISDRTIYSENGIGQTLLVNDLGEHTFEETVIDDCGNSYDSHSFSIQYNTSLSSIWIGVDIRWSGIEDDGFTSSIGYWLTNSDDITVSNNSVYDFVTENTKDANSEVTILEELVIDDRKFEGVMEISFFNRDIDGEVLAIYYSKEYGVMKFDLENGHSYTIE